MIYSDSIFLKGKYLKTLFMVLGKDDNQQVYPLTFDVEVGKKLNLRLGFLQIKELDWSSNRVDNNFISTY